MPHRAIFGPPRDAVAPGGLHISVYLVPVFERSLVVFDVTAAQAAGRWLPWAVIDFRQNPYEAASLLADDWCGVPLEDLSLADVMSIEVGGEGWELAIVFRAELGAPPQGDSERTPYMFEPGRYDAIGPFDPADIQRWVEAAPPTLAGPEGLIF
jgi:hypothetical protein